MLIEVNRHGFINVDAGKLKKASFEELITLGKLLETENANGVSEVRQMVQEYANGLIQNYLDNKILLLPEQAALYLRFIETFGRNADGCYLQTAEKAKDKLILMLEEFDQENNLNDIDAEQVKANLEILEKFEHQDFFTSPELAAAKKVLDALSVTDEQGKDLDENNQKIYKNKIIETAKLGTYCELTLLQTPIDEKTYKNVLAEKLEVNIVNLFMIDKIQTKNSLSEEDRVTLTRKFEDLFKTVAEV